MGAWQARYGRTGSMGEKLQKLAPILNVDRPETMYRGMVSHWQSPGGAEPPTAFTDSRGWLGSADVTARMMYLDLVTYLPDDILVKLDRASMSVGLESRVPFLDPRVIEFAWRLPPAMKIRHGRGKWILRQVLSRYLPASVAGGRKAGFSIPLSRWLRGPLRGWAGDLLSEQSLSGDGYFDSTLVRRAWTEHSSGRRNWEQPLWNVLMFQSWLDEHRSSPVTSRHVPLHA